MKIGVIMYFMVVYSTLLKSKLINFKVDNTDFKSHIEVAALYLILYCQYIGCGWYCIVVSSASNYPELMETALVMCDKYESLNI